MEIELKNTHSSGGGTIASYKNREKRMLLRKTQRNDKQNNAACKWYVCESWNRMYITHTFTGYASWQYALCTRRAILSFCIWAKPIQSDHDLVFSFYFNKIIHTCVCACFSFSGPPFPLIISGSHPFDDLMLCIMCTLVSRRHCLRLH